MSEPEREKRVIFTQKWQVVKLSVARYETANFDISGNATLFLADLFLFRRLAFADIFMCAFFLVTIARPDEFRYRR